jgi:ATP-dependent DNA helicase RecQ
VGNIDRPNLNYRLIARRGPVLSQIIDTILKHPGEPGIIYCIRRIDVDDISKKLNELGYKNLPYHAGLGDNERKHNQEEFSKENVNIIVATIAFGMGVDRSNIRYVIHAAMPKSIEHYQQETGRAGRDGLSADCYLFYSFADFKIWEYMLKDSSDKMVLLQKLRAMYNFCAHPVCRHKYLVNYFAQKYVSENCGACDHCLGEVDVAPAKIKPHEKASKPKPAKDWEGVDKKLFDLLRAKRTQLAGLKNVPAYIIFSDKTLRDMAAVKPTTVEQFAGVFGVGATKQKEYGKAFTEIIRDYVG